MSQLVTALSGGQIVPYLKKLIQQTREREQQPVCAYIYDLGALRERAQRCVSNLPDDCSLFYAVKANPDPHLIASLLPIVKGFEAASIGEIRTIREVSADVPIIFGGPGKKDAEIEEALERKVMLIHAESLHELQRIGWIAERRQQRVSILLRINLRRTLPEASITMSGRPTQFGIDEIQVPEAIRLAQSLPYVQLEGFHMHSLSNNLDARLHARMVATYLQCVQGWIQEHELSIRYLNAGGGFGISYTDLERRFEWDDFMEELHQVWEEYRIPGIQLIFESGRYMVAHCGYYAAEVIDLKTNHDQHYAIIRGGTHHFRLPVSWHHNQPFEVVAVEDWRYPFPRTERRQTAVTIAGELCTPKDVLAYEVYVEHLRIGDVLLFHIAGAYGWTISHHDFLSHPHPHFYYINQN
ncbi:type III PLP-dependent enzyme [Paenibacillus sp. FSL R10-2782]|uniref:type III PLP-dependent enzyme n=1 Tax=Paenibacillus sp. FSL R10-2782 TaxID=2954661 RepID=UPI00315904E1